MRLPHTIPVGLRGGEGQTCNRLCGTQATLLSSLSPETCPERVLEKVKSLSLEGFFGMLCFPVTILQLTVLMLVLAASLLTVWFFLC